MKIYKKILPFMLAVEIIILSLFSCSIPVYAADFMPHDIIEAIEYGLENNDWDPFYKFLYESSDGLMYLVSQMGAVVKQDFILWVDNNQKLESLVNTVPVRKEDDKIVFTKEFMSQLKAILDEYAKQENTKEENGGFILLPTTNFEEVPADYFINSQQFRTFRNIVLEKGVLAVRTKNYGQPMCFFEPYLYVKDSPIYFIGNAGNINSYKEKSWLPVEVRFYYVNDFNYCSYRVQSFPENDKIYTSVSDAVDYETSYSPDINKAAAIINFDIENHGSYSSEVFILYSSTGERVRVFVSEAAAKSYSVGNRKIYFSENYYNYVPEDLTVAVDDLSKSVDDLQKVIDELLKKINDQSSEKEIEELLRQILEELRKNPGTSGEGSGGGDVTVSVDLKETNNWLAKIYNRLGDILNDMQENIQYTLDEISATLKKIKGWSISDSDVGDLVSDLADFVKDLVSDVSGGVSTVTSTMSGVVDLMQTKFPFCLPWDVYLIITFLAHKPQTPVFQLPIIIESYGIEEYIDIDMTRFSVLSSLSRTLLSLIYCYGLTNLTYKVIPMVKEEE